MDTNSFFGISKKPSKFVTVTEALDAIDEEATSATIVILPPESDDKSITIPSDEEDNDDLDTDIFEPAGEVELSVSSSSDEEEEVPQKTKASSSSTVRWKKAQVLIRF